MDVTTVKLSSKGQVVIPKEVRDELHWKIGTELVLVPSANGISLRNKPVSSGQKLADLVGMIKTEGGPVALDDVIKPVDYRADWAQSEQRNR
ncbi:hypothetical protein MCAMS1_02241 [biofilm metagenome]